MIEQNIIFINSEQGVRKDTGEKWYRLHYLKDDRLKTDYVDVISFNCVNKKAKQFVSQIGLFGIDKFDRIVLNDIK